MRITRIVIDIKFFKLFSNIIKKSFGYDTLGDFCVITNAVDYCFTFMLIPVASSLDPRAQLETI